MEARRSSAQGSEQAAPHLSFQRAQRAPQSIGPSQMITIPEWLIGLLGSGAGAIIALLIRNAVAHAKNEASAKAGQAIANEAKAAAAEAQRLAAATERDLAHFREKVATEYATVQLLDRIEERLVGALDRIGERFDQFLLTQGKAK
ncbi:hypothetical protein ACVI1J_009901 [Bradyrhizobium diazoefficiens]